MSTIQNEIQNIKLKNPQNSELLDNVQTENRILKAKLNDMESQLNSLSTNMASNFDRRSSFQNQREIESIQEIKVMFEDKISQMQRENQEKEQYFLSLKQNQDQQQEMIQVKDQIIAQLQYQLEQKNSQQSEYKKPTGYNSCLNEDDEQDLSSRVAQSESQLMRMENNREDQKFTSIRNQNQNIQEYIEMPIRGQRQVISEAELLNFSESNVEQDFVME